MVAVRGLPVENVLPLLFSAICAGTAPMASRQAALGLDNPRHASQDPHRVTGRRAASEPPLSPHAILSGSAGHTPPLSPHTHQGACWEGVLATGSAGSLPASRASPSLLEGHRFLEVRHMHLLCLQRVEAWPMAKSTTLQQHWC